MDPSLLPALAAFVLVARTGSFTRAAAALGVSPSALSQSVRTLEKKLDTRLLHRTTRSVSLTEEGRTLLAQVGPGLQMVEQAVNAIDDTRGQPSGEIRISSSRFASRCLIEPHLRELRARHPDVRLELVLDDGLGDIVKEGCDVGIRLGERLSQGMISVPISPMMRMAVVGSPDYFARRPPPATPADLARHACLRYDEHARTWNFGHGEPVPIGRGLAINSTLAQWHAARRGGGLALLSDYLTQDDVDAGLLVRVLEQHAPTPVPVFAVHPYTRHVPAKVRAAIAYFSEVFASTPR